MGKSTMWKAGVELAAADGFRINTAHPAVAERMLSFAVLRDLLERVEPPPHLPDPQRRAIDVAIRNAYPEGPSPDPLSIAVATTVVLRHLATQPLLVAIDDAQWMDEPSAYTLRYALRRLHGHVGVLVTLRGPGDTDPLALAEAFGERLPRSISGRSR